MASYKNVDVLVGKTLSNIEKKSDRELILVTTENKIYKMLHFQDCCERVYIEDIIGELDDLLYSPLTMAEEVTERSRVIDDDGDDDGSQTWTFYKFATNKGYVTIRWYGSSNGYYSESVSFIKIDSEDEYPDEYNMDDEDFEDDDLKDLRADNGFINITLFNKE